MVVHSIFHTRPEFLKALRDAKASKTEVKTSPYHSLEAWRRRLTTTGARTIVVWELNPFSLNGWQLDELDGYRIAHRDHRVTVYRRKKLH